ncbi:MAG: hypothetical protein PHP86_18785 [Nevskiales bacterium]|nr:hypothetical protein [Nevskiales bacterium]
MPGTYDAWRMAHVEGMINGFALWLAAAILPMVPASLKALRRIGNGMIVVAWTIVIASAFDPLLPASRGLAFGGSLTNTIAFLLFVVGIGIFLAAMVTIAWKSLRAPASSPN